MDLITSESSNEEEEEEEDEEEDEDIDAEREEEVADAVKDVQALVQEVTAEPPLRIELPVSKRIRSQQPLPSIFTPFESPIPQHDVEAIHILAQALQRIHERGMPELQAAFHRTISNHSNARIKQLEARIQELEAKDVAQEVERANVISESKMQEITSAFNARVERDYREKELTIIEPLRKQVAELQEKLQVAETTAPQTAELEAKITELTGIQEKLKAYCQKRNVKLTAANARITEMEAAIARITEMEATIVEKTAAEEMLQKKVKLMGSKLKQQKNAIESLTGALAALKENTSAIESDGEGEE